MKLLTLSLLLISTGSFAQIFVNGTNINEKTDVKVIELVVLEDFIASADISVAVDYGQERKELQDKITDAVGKKLKFGSIVGAINHVENNGWEFLNHSVIQKGRGVIYRYYFKRSEKENIPK